MLIFVDDITITENSNSTIQDIISRLNTVFV